MDIGRFYQKQDEHLAAINRYKRVLSSYQTTTHVPEALYRLVETCEPRHPRRSASRCSRARHNFPSNKWHVSSYDMLEGAGLEPRRKRGGWYDEIWIWSHGSVTDAGWLIYS